jgi:hypothetical protein
MQKDDEIIVNFGTVLNARPGAYSVCWSTPGNDYRFTLGDLFVVGPSEQYHSCVLGSECKMELNVIQNGQHDANDRDSVKFTTSFRNMAALNYNLSSYENYLKEQLRLITDSS